MKQNSLDRWLPLLLALALLAGCGLVFYAAETFSLESVRYEYGDAAPIDRGWIASDGQDTMEVPALPYDALHGGSASVRFSNHIPAGLNSDKALCVVTNHQWVRVYVDGCEIFSYGLDQNTPFGRSFGRQWHVIDIPQEWAGKPLTLEYGNDYGYGRERLYPPVFGDRSAILFGLFTQDLGSLLFCVLTGFIGVTFLLFSLMFYIKGLSRYFRSATFLGLFALLTGIWVLTDSQALQFVFGNPAPIYLATFVSFLLFPVPFLLSVRDACPHARRGLNLLIALFLVQFFCSMALYCLNIVDLTRSLIASHLLLAVGAIYLPVCALRELTVYHNTQVREMAVGFCVLCLSALISLLFFYRQDPIYATIFQYGLFVFILLMSGGVLRNTTRLLRQQAKMDTYKQMAYTDALTLLKNRASFELSLRQMEGQLSPCLPLCIAVCDLNALKAINDTYGHSAGDELIRGFAACLCEAFPDLDTIYRIGGDEFVVLFARHTESEAQERMRHLENRVAQYNGSALYPVNFAWGTASCGCLGPEGCDLIALFNRADADMYNKKAACGRTREDCCP